MNFRYIRFVKNKIHWFIDFYSNYKKANISASKIDLFKSFLSGYYYETYVLFDINKFKKNIYIKDVWYNKAHPFNGKFSSIIDNKIYLPYLLNNYSEYVPKCYYFIDKGKLFDLRSNKKVSNMDDFIEFVVNQKKCVFKHTSLSGGKGFYLLQFEENKFYLNKKNVSKNEIVEFIQSLTSYIIVEFIIQADYAMKINDSSVNTIRMICVYDEDKERFIMPLSFHRFGTNGDVVDNISSGGGCLVYVDVETGRTKDYGIARNNKGELILKKNIIHPDSEIDLSNFVIPRFVDIKNKILEIMNSFVFLKYVGVDVVVTNNSFKIIEINSFPGIKTIMGSEDYAGNDVLRKFYKKHGLL
jgi:hypothetical protein